MSTNDIENPIEYKDHVHIKRPYDAEITKFPKKPLTKKQRQEMVEKHLGKGIIAYKKRMGTWNLVGDTEDAGAFNPYVEGYNPEEIEKELKPVDKEIRKFTERIEKWKAKRKEKGKLTPKEEARLIGYTQELSALNKKKKKILNRFYAGQFQTPHGPRLFNDDIGQEAVLFFYRTLDRFDVSKYEGNIGKVNEENTATKKTKKTLSFYFQNFLFTAITNCAKDAIKKQRSMNFGVFVASDSHTNTYGADEAIENNIHIERDESEDVSGEVSFEKFLKLDLIKYGISSIENVEVQKFIQARVELPKNVVQMLYGEDFNYLNDEFLNFRAEMKRLYEKEKGLI